MPLRGYLQISIELSSLIENEMQCGTKINQQQQMWQHDVRIWWSFEKVTAFGLMQTTTGHNTNIQSTAEAFAVKLVPLVLSID